MVGGVEGRGRYRRDLRLGGGVSNEMRGQGLGRRGKRSGVRRERWEMLLGGVVVPCGHDWRLGLNGSAVSFACARRSSLTFTS